MGDTVRGAEAIFAPVSVLALWTGFVLFMTGFRRIRAVRQGRVPAASFRLGESPDVPTDVSVANRNLMNLLEMPLLFYVVCVLLYVTRRTDAFALGAAWVYVGLRIVHTGIHLTSNRIVRRLVAFAAGNFVLLVLWLCFIVRGL